MSIKVDVSVIIINYKTKHLIRECLTSLFKNTRGIALEVFVVDNNSQDDIGRMLENEFKSVHFIGNTVNSGFGAANNVAIKKAKGKYIYLLNPDTLIVNNAIKYFYDYCEENIDIGCVGGWLEDLDGNSIHSHGNFINYWRDIFYIFGYNLKKLLNIKKTRIRRLNFSKKTEPFIVEYITGASLFIPCETFKKIGLFDESFFMYSEEADLQIRMSKVGLSRVVIPRPRVIHLEGKSFSLSNSRRIMMDVSKIKFIKKHNGNLSSILMKVVYVLSATIGTVADLYYKEYTYLENLQYLKAVLNDNYK